MAPSMVPGRSGQTGRRSVNVTVMLSKRTRLGPAVAPPRPRLTVELTVRETVVKWSFLTVKRMIVVSTRVIQ